MEDDTPEVHLMKEAEGGLGLQLNDGKLACVGPVGYAQSTTWQTEMIPKKPSDYWKDIIWGQKTGQVTILKKHNLNILSPNLVDTLNF